MLHVLTLKSPPSQLCQFAPTSRSSFAPHQTPPIYPRGSCSLQLIPSMDTLDHGLPALQNRSAPITIQLTHRPAPTTSTPAPARPATHKDVQTAQLIKALKKLNFKNISKGSMMLWTLLNATTYWHNHVTLALECHGSPRREYLIYIAPLGANSLNPDADFGRRQPQESLVELVFVDDQGRTRQRMSVPIGRLHAIGGYKDELGMCKMHWVVLVDENKSVWACYADGGVLPTLR